MPTRDVVLYTVRVHRQQGLQRRRRSGSTSSSCSTPEKRRASPNLRQSHFSWPPAGTSTWPLTRETPWCQVGLDMCVLVALQRRTSRTTRTTSTAGNAARARRSSDHFFRRASVVPAKQSKTRPDGSDSPAQMLRLHLSVLAALIALVACGLIGDALLGAAPTKAATE